MTYLEALDKIKYDIDNDFYMVQHFVGKEIHFWSSDCFFNGRIVTRYFFNEGTLFFDNGKTYYIKSFTNHIEVPNEDDKEALFNFNLSCTLEQKYIDVFKEIVALYRRV